MLSGIGWLVVVWVVWTAIGVITTWLVRVTMHGQQDVVIEAEAMIAAEQAKQSYTEPLSPPSEATSARLRPERPERPEPRAPQPLGPPLSAT
jgi:hypothetical protein